MKTASKVVWLVQPYIPGYRVALFERLTQVLAKKNVELKVVAGSPGGVQRKRNDSSKPSWLIVANRVTFSIFGREIVLSNTYRHWKHADAVILPHVGASLDSWIAVLTRGPKVGLWGHIASYVKKGNSLDMSLERLQLRRADHIFAYTNSGAKYAERVVNSSIHVTQLDNSLDTNMLTQALEAARDDHSSWLAIELESESRPIIAFIGGVDKTKRIEFLVKSLNLATAAGLKFRLIVVGEGPELVRFEKLSNFNDVIFLGHDEGHAKALALTHATCIASPGRVGLLAVEALVSGVPIVTTDWEYHAPEFEYLKEGESKFTSENSVTDYAKTLSEVVGHRERVEKTEWTHPNLESMVQNFSSGILKMLEMSAE